MIALIAALEGCGGGTEPTPPGGGGGPSGAPVGLITVNYPGAPDSSVDYVLPADTLQITAQAFDTARQPISGVAFTWSTSDPTVLRVSSAGVVQGVHPGQASVTAAAGGKQASATVFVLVPVAAVEVAPQDLGLVPGGFAELNFALRDSTGARLDPRPLGFGFTLPGFGQAVQTVGRLSVQVTGPGTSVLTVAREGKSAQTTITVTNVHFTAIDANGDRGCGLAGDGTTWCWGDNAMGALGYGGDNTLSAQGWPTGATPVRVAGGHHFTQISVGNSHACALVADGSAYCWGNNTTGALGVSGVSYSAVPVAVSGGLHFTQIAASYAYTCGLATDGTAYCWGFNDNGQLGDGTTTTRFAPVSVSGGLTFRQVSNHAGGTCGLTPAGVAYCWGNGAAPALAPGTRVFDSLSAGGIQTCGIEPGGDAYCWGSYYGAQYGDIHALPTLVPGGLKWRSLSVTVDHACGVTQSGAGYCWGFNDAGQLGTGDRTSSLTDPVSVGSIGSFVSIAVAPNRSCSLASDGRAYCWGAGALGTGADVGHALPRQVAGQL